MICQTPFRKFVSSRKALCLFQIELIETFGEPAIDRSEQSAGLIPLALIAKKPRHAHSARSSPDFASCRRAQLDPKSFGSGGKSDATLS